MTDRIFEQFGDKIASNSRLGRVGEAQDIAGLAIFLSSRAGAYVHGAVIPVDGGTIVNQRHSQAINVRPVPIPGLSLCYAASFRPLPRVWLAIIDVSVSTSCGGMS